MTEVIARVKIRVDDELLQSRVAAFHEMFRDDTDVTLPSPAAYFSERIQALCEDEIPVALWGLNGCGLEVTLEEVTSE